MNGFIEIISGIEEYLIIGLVIITIILSVLVIVLLTSLNSLEKRYRKFMRGVNNKSIEEHIINYLDKVDEAKELAERVKSLYEDMDNRINGCIQKVSMVRYKAFDDVGSDLSFSIAFLDNDNNGVIVTGIYGRQDSTTYAKPVEKGISRYDLSDEEKEVLSNAINKGKR